MLYNPNNKNDNHFDFPLKSVDMSKLTPEEIEKMVE